MTHVQIVEAFRAKIKEIKQTHHDRSFSILSQDTEYDKKANRFVAVIDSITSVPGVLLPWQEMVKVCKEEGVWSVIDAAHSIGQEVRCGLGLYFNDLFTILDQHQPERSGPRLLGIQLSQVALRKTRVCRRLCSGEVISESYIFNVCHLLIARYIGTSTLSNLPFPHRMLIQERPTTQSLWSSMNVRAMFRTPIVAI